MKTSSPDCTVKSIGPILKALYLYLGSGWAFGYLMIFAAILACETFGGVMLGARVHSLWRGVDD